MPYDKKAGDKRYRDAHREEHKVYAKDYYEKNKAHLAENTHDHRLARRREIQRLWGVVGGEKGTWRNLHWVDSEKVAVKVLEAEGYHNVRRLDYFKTSPFDIRAENESSQVWVFQITMRTHQDSHRWHLRLAEDLGLLWRVLYIRPRLDKYIIKSPYESGCEELTLGDLQNLKAVPLEATANQ